MHLGVGRSLALGTLDGVKIDRPNLAAALNVLSDQSTALAGAAQTAPITQAT